VASRHGNDGEQQQHTVINNFVSRHGSGTVRSVGRDWWLRWFGVLDTPAARVFEELLPCHAIIMTTTGLPAKAEGKFTTPESDDMMDLKQIEQALGVRFMG
jgi:hypothetical protein